MLSDEERKEYEELKSLLYTGTISQYGKRKLIEIIEKQSKEIEELKEKRFTLFDTTIKATIKINDKKWEDKIKAKIEESELLIDNSQGCMSNEDLYKEFGKIEFGKSLLEKE